MMSPTESPPSNNSEKLEDIPSYLNAYDHLKHVSESYNEIDFEKAFKIQHDNQDSRSFVKEFVSVKIFLNKLKNFDDDDLTEDGIEFRDIDLDIIKSDLSVLNGIYNARKVFLYSDFSKKNSSKSIADNGENFIDIDDLSSSLDSSIEDVESFFDENSDGDIDSGMEIAREMYHVIQSVQFFQSEDGFNKDDETHQVILEKYKNLLEQCSSFITFTPGDNEVSLIAKLHERVIQKSDEVVEDGPKKTQIELLRLMQEVRFDQTRLNNKIKEKQKQNIENEQGQDSGIDADWLFFLKMYNEISEIIKSDSTYEKGEQALTNLRDSIDVLISMKDQIVEREIQDTLDGVAEYEQALYDKQKGNFDQIDDYDRIYTNVLIDEIDELNASYIALEGLIGKIDFSENYETLAEEIQQTFLRLKIVEHDQFYSYLNVLVVDNQEFEEVYEELKQESTLTDDNGKELDIKDYNNGQLTDYYNNLNNNLRAKTYEEARVGIENELTSLILKLNKVSDLTLQEEIRQEINKELGGLDISASGDSLGQQIARLDFDETIEYVEKIFFTMKNGASGSETLLEKFNTRVEDIFKVESLKGSVESKITNAGASLQKLRNYPGLDGNRDADSIEKVIRLTIARSGALGYPSRIRDPEQLRFEFIQLSILKQDVNSLNRVAIAMDQAVEKITELFQALSDKEEVTSILAELEFARSEYAQIPKLQQTSPKGIDAANKISILEDELYGLEKSFSENRNDDHVKVQNTLNNFIKKVLVVSPESASLYEKNILIKINELIEANGFSAIKYDDVLGSDSWMRSLTRNHVDTSSDQLVELHLFIQAQEHKFNDNEGRLDAAGIESLRQRGLQHLNSLENTLLPNMSAAKIKQMVAMGIDSSKGVFASKIESGINDVGLEALFSTSFIKYLNAFRTQYNSGSLNSKDILKVTNNILSDRHFNAVQDLVGISSSEDQDGIALDDKMNEYAVVQKELIEVENSLIDLKNKADNKAVKKNSIQDKARNFFSMLMPYDLIQGTYEFQISETNKRINNLEKLSNDVLKSPDMILDDPGVLSVLAKLRPKDIFIASDKIPDSRLNDEATFRLNILEREIKDLNGKVINLKDLQQKQEDAQLMDLSSQDSKFNVISKKNKLLQRQNDLTTKKNHLAKELKDDGVVFDASGSPEHPGSMLHKGRQPFSVFEGTQKIDLENHITNLHDQVDAINVKLINGVPNEEQVLLKAKKNLLVATLENDFSQFIHESQDNKTKEELESLIRGFRDRHTKLEAQQNNYSFKNAGFVSAGLRHTVLRQFGQGKREYQILQEDAVLAERQYNQFRDLYVKESVVNSLKEQNQLAKSKLKERLDQKENQLASVAVLTGISRWLSKFTGETLSFAHGPLQDNRLAKQLSVRNLGLAASITLMSASPLSAGVAATWGSYHLLRDISRSSKFETPTKKILTAKYLGPEIDSMEKGSYRRKIAESDAKNTVEYKFGVKDLIENLKNTPNLTKEQVLDKFGKSNVFKELAKQQRMSIELGYDLDNSSNYNVILDYIIKEIDQFEQGDYKQTKNNEQSEVAKRYKSNLSSMLNSSKGNFEKEMSNIGNGEMYRKLAGSLVSGAVTCAASAGWLDAAWDYLWSGGGSGMDNATVSNIMNAFGDYTV